MCRRGFSDVQRFLEETEDANLRAYVIFMPMLDEDSEAVALERVGEFQDERLTYFWDAEIVSGLAWRETYDLDLVVWDVYFLYGAGTTWQELPTRAHYGATGHRAIGDVIPKLRVELFTAEARKLLEE